VNGTGRYRVNEQSWQVSQFCEKVWPLVIASMQAALDVIGAIDAKLARAGLAMQWDGHAISRLMGLTWTCVSRVREGTLSLLMRGV
jgi:hypothetical protein